MTRDNRPIVLKSGEIFVNVFVETVLRAKRILSQSEVYLKNLSLHGKLVFSES
jgi:hypothetical protein